MLKITIVALGNKMPHWVMEGTKDYAKRFGDAIQLKIIEIPLMRRGKSTDINRILEKESDLMLAAIPQGARRIALEIAGKTFSSEGLASTLSQLQQQSSHLCFLIGGPEGLSRAVLALVDERWSLSQLTLPHPLVRIILLETLYRAWSILQNHPYHK